MNSNKVQFYNTLSRKKEIFTPIDAGEVRMYSCGPTVYDYAHIGNLRAYVFADTLFRTLSYAGYKIKRVMNITDIGHLSSDADSGEDKMTKGLLREGKELTLENMKKMAVFYTEKFKEDIQKLYIEIPKEIYFASDFIKEDIELIKKLETKGYAYKISDGIYFDTSKDPNYGKLALLNREKETNKSRIAKNAEKKNPEDFALWKFDNKIGFTSPFGQGFPGWHIECSAMSIKFLGEQFDIHTGGIDHVPVHHTNEIAQSECATGKKPFVKFWMHNEHLDLKGEKIAKSTGNLLRLQDLEKAGINPLAYRFWLLMGHYRTKLNFNIEAVEGAETALKRLYSLYSELSDEDGGQINPGYQNRFKAFVFDDLDTPRALTLLWELMKDEKVLNKDKKITILDFDKILGLGFEKIKKENLPQEVEKLLEERLKAREDKDFKKGDELREKIKYLGYEVKDTSEGQKIIKIELL